MKREALGALALFVVYQAVWFGAVASAARGWVWIGPALVALFVLGFALRLERGLRGRWLLAVALLGLAGTAADSTLAACGFVRFNAELLPGVASPWITSLWCLMAVALPGLGLLLARRPWLAALLGAVGGPAAYAAGVRMGAAAFPEPAWPSLLAIGVEWGIAFPLMLRVPALVRPDAGGTR